MSRSRDPAEERKLEIAVGRVHIMSAIGPPCLLFYPLLQCMFAERNLLDSLTSAFVGVFDHCAADYSVRRSIGW